MATNKKISALDIAAPLDGTEPVPIAQAGDTVQTTTQDIANLGGSSGFPITGSADGNNYSIIDTSGNMQMYAEDIATTNFSGFFEIQPNGPAQLAQTTMGVSSASHNAFLSLLATDASSPHSVMSLSNDGQTVNFIVGTGSPSGSVTAVKGSLYFDKTAPALYQNTNGTTGWSQFGVSGGGVLGMDQTLSGPHSGTTIVPSGFGGYTNTGWVNIYADDSPYTQWTWGTKAGNKSQAYLIVEDAGIHQTILSLIGATGVAGHQTDASFTLSDSNAQFILEDLNNGASFQFNINSSAISLFIVEPTGQSGNVLGIYDHSIKLLFGIDSGGGLWAPHQYFNIGNTSGTWALNLSNGLSQQVAVTGNITTVTITNVPSSGVNCRIRLFVKQVSGLGGTITWPASFKWPSGTAPTLSAASKTDIIEADTFDGGTTWYARAVAQNYS